MAVVEALDIQPDHFVLDIAAAPGGKATHAASRLGSDGLLMANEVVSGRLGPLLANLDGWGYANTAVASTRAARLAELYPAFFDRVIVDAPCTGEALFRRDPASRAQWSEAQVRGAARRQAKLLASAARTAAPGALLAYSTCTFGPAENEEQIARFLDEHAAWEPLDISSLPGSEHGRLIGIGAGHEKALLFLPHECRCEGQFVSVLQAPGEPRDGPSQVTGRRKPSQPPHPAWAAFAAETLHTEFDSARVLLRGDTFFLQPRALQEPAPLLRPGLQLGRLVGKTFRPAHALAMALDPGAVSAAEAVDNDDLAEFRSGRSVSRPGPPGWVLVTLEGWPIGWAQRKGNVLTPRLPAHARQRA
jgi:NOL1/NOP2/fmu family ribosome biogenesis protein